MLATANFVWVPPILQFTWEACAGSAFTRKFVPVNVMLSVCDGEVLAGEGFGLMLVRLGSGFGGGLMMKAVGVRSEERRVGEEGRSRWAPDYLKKKKTEALVADVRMDDTNPSGTTPLGLVKSMADGARMMDGHAVGAGPLLEMNVRNSQARASRGS